MKLPGIGLCLWRGVLTAAAVAIGVAMLFLLARGIGIHHGYFLWCVLVGPIPLLITLFDVTNAQVWAFTYVSTVPYWLILGACAGWLRWLDESGAPEESLSQKGRPTGSILGLVLAFALASGILGHGSLPRADETGGRIGNTIMSNLGQITSAKQQLALEHALPATYIPSEAELAPYLPPPDRFPRRRPLGERYVINAIDTPPYAVLDSDYRVRRRGWREGYTVTKGKVFRLN